MHINFCPDLFINGKYIPHNHRYFTLGNIHKNQSETNTDNYLSWIFIKLPSELFKNLLNLPYY